MTHYVSLITKKPQEIQPNRYTLLSFPAGEESSDEDKMHSSVHPELIHPCTSGIGLLEANIFWEPGNYTKICDRFDRDPLSKEPDKTGYEHRNPCPEMQCIVKLHTIVVYPNVPLGVLVRHNDRVSRHVTQAQFKLTIFT